jgi:four helix bundle protein
MKLTRFEDLEIWKDARELCREIYKITSTEAFSKDFRFKDQIKASSGSIMDNISEGFEGDGNKEFLQYLSIAKGSCGETRSQCYRAFDFHYIDSKTLQHLLDQTTTLSKKIAGFISYLKKSSYKGSKYK